MQTFSIFLSSNENPEKADVNITGKDKSTAAKTGTESEPSQKRTIKITETSGTERINVRGSSKKNFKTENFVHKKPNKIPRKDEIEKLLSVFMEFEPASVGGKLPDGGFYFE